VAVVLVAAAAALAATFPTVTLKPTVSSTKAGTKKHPKGVKLTTLITWQKLGPVKQPIVTKFRVWFPKGSLYRGGKYPSCSRSKISRGPSRCPKGSIMGSGSGTAYAGPLGPKTHPKITVVNGGKKIIWFYTVLNNPARVREPVTGKLTSLHGKYAYELTVKVPRNLQIVAGTPIELTMLKVNAGSSKTTWLSTTGCSNHKWPFKITTNYKNPNTGKTGSAGYSSAIHCT
jgi:hypothetical protein